MTGPTAPPPGTPPEVHDIPAALAGVRLDRAVAMLADVTRAEAAFLVDEGAVEIGGVPVRERARRLAEHDLVSIGVRATGLPAKGAPLEPSDLVPFTVVFEDDEIVVVDKPPGVVVHPGAGNRAGTLAAGLLARYPEIGQIRSAEGDADRPGIVHRLDKETSGLLVVARTAPALASLQAQLAARTMGRRYLAIVLGRLESSRGVIDAPIGRSTTDPTKMAVTTAGRHARTAYEVLGVFDEPLPASELELALETGRTHQIRVHVAAIGHPVLGDSRYGGVRGALPVGRCMLHAWRLRLVHPRSGEELEFEAPVPADFNAALGQLS